MPSNPVQIFFDHDYLDVEVERRTEVEEVAANHDKIVSSRVRHQPVELLERVVQVGSEEHFHWMDGTPGCGSASLFILAAYQ
jgi:hypothetical protein